MVMSRLISYIHVTIELMHISLFVFANVKYQDRTDHPGPEGAEQGMSLFDM